LISSGRSLTCSSPRGATSAQPAAWWNAPSARPSAPVEVVTDRAPVHADGLEELLPAAWHRTDRCADNRIEADRGHLKSRLHPMRGPSRTTVPGEVIAGHAVVQNILRGHYQLAVAEPATRRVAVAFDELALAI
jgi:transposase-like protein